MKKFILIILVLLSIEDFSYGNELKEVVIEEFIAQNPSDERKKIIHSITSQFNGKSVNQAQLDSLWNDVETREYLHLARFQIIDQKLYASGADETYIYFKELVRCLQRMIVKYKIEDVDFIVHTSDQLRMADESDHFVKKLADIPTFMMFKDLDDQYERDRLLIPEVLILKNSWYSILEKVKAASEQSSWENKIEKIYWRGSTTGVGTLPYSLNNFDKLPRLSLVMLSKLYPDIIDARFTFYVDKAFHKGDEVKKVLKILFPEKLIRVSEGEHVPYKYLISIDGNSCTGTRLPWIMYSNSVLVKQETNKVEWFYSALSPYINYVPVNESLTDLFAQFVWMKNHDDKVRQISINAHNFIANDLMPEHIEAHMVLTLNQYHKIQQDKKLIPTLPTAEETRSFEGIVKATFYRIKRSLFNYIKSLF